MRSTTGHSTEFESISGDVTVGDPKVPAGTSSFGPLPSQPRPDQLAESFAFCGEVARCEAGNFYWSFRLLPRESRQAMCALYAFMRHTDDLADGDAPANQRQADLAAWRQCLDEVLDAAAAADPAACSMSAWKGFPALAETVRRHAIPRSYLHAVIEGMVYDLGPVRTKTGAEFEKYCWHVASAVGLCCLHIWGFESRGGRAEALAERLGLAFQRTNILRDVAEDYARGRVYLPAEDLSKFHVREAELAADRASEGLRALVAAHAARARGEYRAVDELLPLISPSCRPMLRAIARIYEALLDRIQLQDYDVLKRRASIPKWRKAAIMVGAIFG